MPLARDTAKQISLIKKRFVYLTYVDDSGSTGGQLEDPQSRFQIIGGPIIREDLNMAIEVPSFS
jgi:hypothetical protein